MQEHLPLGEADDEEPVERKEERCFEDRLFREDDLCL